MNANESNDDVFFDSLTLRLVVGALAIAFPAVVIVLTGKVPTSISAAVHEDKTRNILVGFTFILGALLICYKGHLQGEPKQPEQSVWSWIFSLCWVKVYQEDLASTCASIALFVMAFYPIPGPDQPINFNTVARANLHNFSAVVLFVILVYSCLIAFPRSLNRKLINDNKIDQLINKLINSDKINKNDEHQTLGKKERRENTQSDMNPFRKVRDFLIKVGVLLFPEILTFLAIAIAVFLTQSRQNVLQKVWMLLWEYDKKFSRGITYVISSCAMLLTLLWVVVLIRIRPGWEETDTLFIVETILLVSFGISWLTASRLKFISQVVGWVKALKTRLRKSEATPEPG